MREISELDEGASRGRFEITEHAIVRQKVQLPLIVSKTNLGIKSAFLDLILSEKVL